ncbi:addiction module toxin RelE [Mycobacterium vulneris]|uniref:Type II toxin-antitoxin system RelE/ParE family toxin n=1 Tax=Mycolicibacterium septicum DSM 44393 TaxID=1341646 RepID=A0A7X6MXT7_9MYCO|nr:MULTISPECIES: type II toxin-antitoxin system RelE/ParE family toxin [Mycolicibacterium]MBX8690607.1 type II toxin-antitoxin system RelE/ParE family toxin [Mycobacterium sp. 20091114027_K0903767]MCP3810866.1 type II toxin-antitoxin system RelE/ParE family toxin [Mycobacteriaceae bacterium Msp059]OCB48615.1 addiction module toxin RelE [Mycolicibacterium vulneris]NKZ14954.1 type II toxin-antitoxin system RelE/ParE family toxin [Mycolicibacterium septicum DSM 44393]OBK04819.1 addiction module t
MPDSDNYTTRFTATARRDLDKLPPRILGAVIEFAFGDLAREPRRVGKPLGRELTGQHSARRGPYRVLYRIDDESNTIWVHRIDHRANIYRP